MNLIKVIQQNMNAGNENIGDMMEVILEKEPQIIFFSEFCWEYHCRSIIERIEDEFEIITPSTYDIVKNGGCRICILAMKKNVGYKFIQRTRNYISTCFRYIEGTLKIDETNSIELFFAHVPQTYVDTRKKTYLYRDVEYYLDRLEYKAEMLFAVYSFFNEYKDKNIFIGGDMNTEIDGTTRMEAIFKEVYKDAIDTDTHKPTWKNKCLDYALVSKKMNKCTTTRISSTSDHKALMSEIIL